MLHGAFSCLIKPVSGEDLERALDRLKSYIAQHRKRLLLVEDNENERQAIVELLQHDDIEIEVVATGSALQALDERPFDCCVVDLRPPNINGYQLLEQIDEMKSLSDLPIIVWTGSEVTGEQHERLKAVARSLVLKVVQSPERLFDETALFLHRVVADLPESRQRLLERLHASTEVLHGCKVLVVDDDPRNIFAVTTVLENEDMEVLSATNGRQAIELIQKTPDLDVVLMDIMMPEMDGYETMQDPHPADPGAHGKGDERRS